MLRVDKDKDDGQEILAELLEEDYCRTEIIVALLCERVWTWENTMILKSLHIFVRGCPMSVQRMHKNGVLCTLQSFMLL
jgi:hypothetical protein